MKLVNALSIYTRKELKGVYNSKSLYNKKQFVFSHDVTGLFPTVFACFEYKYL